MWNRILKIFLILVITFSFVPSNVFAENIFNYGVKYEIKNFNSTLIFLEKVKTNNKSKFVNRLYIKATDICNLLKNYGVFKKKLYECSWEKRINSFGDTENKKNSNKLYISLCADNSKPCDENQWNFGNNDELINLRLSFSEDSHQILTDYFFRGDAIGSTKDIFEKTITDGASNNETEGYSLINIIDKYGLETKYVPLRFLAESLGFTVIFPGNDENSNIINNIIDITAYDPVLNKISSKCSSGVTKSGWSGINTRELHTCKIDGKRYFSINS